VIYARFGLAIHQLELVHTQKEIVPPATHVLQVKLVFHQPEIVHQHQKTVLMAIHAPMTFVLFPQVDVILYRGTLVGVTI